jgi:UDPglucose 6-dehydrogenase
VVYICVGTPPRPDGSTDMTYIEGAAAGIAESIERYTVVVNKSTGPGRHRRLREEDDHRQPAPSRRLRRGLEPRVSARRLRHPRRHEPDRIVIGAPNQVVALRILELYAPLESKMILTDVASAEMIKYASNAFLAMKISFANSVANLCEKVGADVIQVAKGMGTDNRIGAAFLQAGLGYGGSCFPKDVRSLLHTAQDNGYDFPLLTATVNTNEAQTKRFIAKMEAALGGFEGKKIAVLGLAFKANTDDMREAKSLEVIEALLAGGATVTTFDPIAMENTKSFYPNITYSRTAFDAASGADAVAVLTEWNEFKQINLERLKEVMNGNLVFDGRNLYDPAKMERLGFQYVCVGRGNVSATAEAAQLASLDGFALNK